jgi:hypothetical protein
MKIYHPAWENAAKDGGMRFAFPPYACWAAADNENISSGMGERS